jgi:hypothetical protein
MSVKLIKEAAWSSGLRKVRGWNVSDLLLRAKGLAVRTDDGWELTDTGRAHVGPLVDAPEARLHNVSASLRAVVGTMTNADVKSFLEEAVACFEHGYHRAAIVLSWVGATATLHRHVVAKKLTDFNAEATRRTTGSNKAWKAAKSEDDLGAMKEFDLLQVLAAIGVIGKNVKDRLEVALKLRNACGHPTSLKVASNEAAAHIEALISNVFTQF